MSRLLCHVCILNVKVDLIENYEKRLINSKIAAYGEVLKYFSHCIMDKKILNISTFRSDQSSKLKINSYQSNKCTMLREIQGPLSITLFVLEDMMIRSYSGGGQFGTTFVVSSNSELQMKTPVIVHENIYQQ